MVKIKPFLRFVGLIYSIGLRGSKTKAKVNFPFGRLARWLVGFAALWLVAFDPRLSQNPSH